MYESTDIDEPLLQSRDRVGNGTEILTYCAGFCTATNSDKLSDRVKAVILSSTPSTLR
jgi:hypothetical protein